MKVTSIEGNRQLLDGGAMFGNAPKPMWERWITPDERNRIPLACRCFLVELDGKKILLETGVGAFFDPKLADRYGVESPDRHLLIENLESHGIQETDIDFVILSHLHFDHAGGLLPIFGSNKKDLHFPNAIYIAGKEAFERAKNPHPRDRASFLPILNDLLENSGRLKLIDRDDPEVLFDGKIFFLFTDGHTPGQMHTVLSSNGSKAMFAGDLVPGEAWMHISLTMGYDRFPEKVIEEKADLYETAIPEKWRMLFTHDPKISSAIPEKNEKGRVVGIESIETLNALEI